MTRCTSSTAAMSPCATTPLGDSAMLRILGPGDVVGELAAVLPAPRNATVTALEAVETLALHRDDVAQLRADHPVVDQVLIAAARAGGPASVDQLLEALYVPVPKRVVGRLSEVAALFDNGGGPVTVPLRRTTSPS